MSPSLVEVLHKSIFMSIVNDWMNEFDVCGLDSAFCSGERSIFLHYLKNCQLPVEDVNMSNYEEFLEWVDVRGMTCKRLKFSFRSMELNSWGTSILSRTKHLKYLEAPCSMGLIPLLKTCCSIEVWKIAKDELISMRVLLELVPLMVNLDELDFSECVAVVHDHKPTSSLHVKRLVYTSVEFEELTSSCRYLECFKGPNTSSTLMALTHSFATLRSVIFLRDDDIDDDGLLLLAEFCKLTCFKVSSDLITDKSVVSLVQHCTGLTTLRLSCPLITDASAAAISLNCVELSCLILQFSQITDAGVKMITMRCKKLNELSLRSQYVYHLSMVYIAQYCKTLEYLDIRNCHITDELIGGLLLSSRNLLNINCDNSIAEHLVQLLAHQIVHFKSCTDLDNYAIQVCNKIGGVELNYYGIYLSELCIMSMILRCPGLLTFRSEFVNDNCIELLVRCCPLLEDIGIMDCEEVTVQCIPHISNGCVNLRSLCISGLENLTDTLIASLVEKHPSLDKLSLPNCSGYSNKAVHSIMTNCSELRSVNLSGNDIITTSAVIDLWNACSRLTCLDVARCRLLGSHLLVAIAAKKRKLRRVDVTGCLSLTKQDCWKFVAATTGLIFNVLF